MGPYFYVVDSINGDYAYLNRTDIESDELFQVALALLPDGMDEGTHLRWENLIYEIID